MSQDCGSCIHFLKIRGNWGNGGLCEFQDHRTNTDYGHKCPDFKRPKHTKADRKEDTCTSLE